MGGGKGLKMDESRNKILQYKRGQCVCVCTFVQLEITVQVTMKHPVTKF